MRIFFPLIFLLICMHSYAQTVPDISESEVSRIEKTLASDNMQGRKVYTPGIETAASFIAREFKDAGLKPLMGLYDFRQSFTMVDPELVEADVMLDGVSVDKNKVIAFTAVSALTITEENSYLKVYVKNLADFNKIIIKYLDATQDVLIFVDTSLFKKFKRLAAFHIPQFEGCGNRIFLITEKEPKQYRIGIKQKTVKKDLTNLVGIIPGKSKPDEYVIFSAHYDHLGIGIPDAKGDSIYNGANDDASGTTAVIALANYFVRLNNNERTIIFAAFTAEEIGEFGSAYFSKRLDPDRVVAMINIEMIGTDSKWGRNSAYISGFDKSSLGSILQRNLVNTQFRFYPDPYPEQQLFLRSDNATLAKRGVPAHSISTSKMDDEPNYHQLTDEVVTLDLGNMTEIIRAIGLSAGSIISGKEAPSRVLIIN